MTTVNDGLALVLTDYPLKSMAYQNLCETCFPNLNIITASDPKEMRGISPQVVLVDLNVMPKDEPSLKNNLLEIFTKSNIVLMEEDHEKIEICRNNSELLISIGKRSEKSRLEAVLQMLASLSHTSPLSDESDGSKLESHQKEPIKSSIKSFLEAHQVSYLS